MNYTILQNFITSKLKAIHKVELGEKLARETVAKVSATNLKLPNYGLQPLGFSVAIHFLILLSLLLNFDAKFSKQQIVNIQLFASTNSANIEKFLKQSSIQKSISNLPDLSNNKSKNLEAIESEAIYNAKYLNNPTPIYPPLAKSRGIEGKVLLEVLVSDAGEALNVKIVNSSGSNLLDESALDTIKNWKFIPAQKFGKAVQARVMIPIEFKII